MYENSILKETKEFQVSHLNVDTELGSLCEFLISHDLVTTHEINKNCILWNYPPDFKLQCSNLPLRMNISSYRYFGIGRRYYTASDIVSSQ